MREGINFGQVRTNSQYKIPKKKLNNPTLSRKINLKRLKHSQETVTGKKQQGKENPRVFEHKADSSTGFSPFCFEF